MAGHPGPRSPPLYGAQTGGSFRTPPNSGSPPMWPRRPSKNGGWIADPLYQGARKNVEGLMASKDWGEVVIGANLVLEPLFGVLARREFFSRFAPRNGDAVTPAVLATAETDWQRNLQWTKAFVNVLLRDPEHGQG